MSHLLAWPLHQRGLGDYPERPTPPRPGNAQVTTCGNATQLVATLLNVCNALPPSFPPPHVIQRHSTLTLCSHLLGHLATASPNRGLVATQNTPRKKFKPVTSIYITLVPSLAVAYRQAGNAHPPTHHPPTQGSYNVWQRHSTLLNVRACVVQRVQRPPTHPR